MRVDHVLIVTDLVFFVLAIFFSGLTFQVTDPGLRIELVALSSSLFVGGVIVVIALILLYSLKKVFFEKREL